MTVPKVTAETIRAMKGRQKVAALTVYDYPMAKLVDEAGVPLMLVGDTLGMVVLGHPDTTHVTMADMEHHLRAAARAKSKALLAADLPYRSYETPRSAVENARRLLAAGAEAVKAEGGRPILEQVKAITTEGIPFIGHLGMLPQHVREEGGYKIKGKTELERQNLIEDALALTHAGAFAIVLEIVRHEVAAEITAAVPIPTIGIGSGAGCDGQILVTHDLIGLFPWFTPKFVRPRVRSAEQIKAAIADWMKSVQA